MMTKMSIGRLALSANDWWWAKCLAESQSEWKLIEGPLQHVQRQLIRYISDIARTLFLALRVVRAEIVAQREVIRGDMN